VTLEAGAASV